MQLRSPALGRPPGTAVGAVLAALSLLDLCAVLTTALFYVHLLGLDWVMYVALGDSATMAVERIVDGSGSSSSRASSPQPSAPASTRSRGFSDRLMRDVSRGVLRGSQTEVRRRSCASHLRRVFLNGPRATRQRYCMNSVALTLEPGRGSA